LIRILKFLSILLFTTTIYTQSEYIYILGNTQDAGMPHIGCKHKFCLDNFTKYEEYYVTSIAVVNQEKKKYILFEATPDITRQLNYLKDNIFQEFRLPEAIYITHAHIGHYTGLMYFGREALGSKNLLVKVLPKMSNFLKTNGPWSQLVRLNNIQIQNTKFDEGNSELSNIDVIPIQVPHRDEYSETAGYIIKGKNKKALFIPDIDKWEKWDKKLIDLVNDFDYLLLDATFYDSMEINRDISEIPHPLVSETISLLNSLSKQNKSKVHFIHMNHTNSMLNPNSDLSKSIINKGFNIARLGQKLYL
jgi:pyrroloquinoline quinone biosynthesis protein B